MAEEQSEAIRRWTAKPRTALVLSLVEGDISVMEAAQQYGLTVGEVEEWRARFLVGGENALRSRPKDEEAMKDAQIKKLKQKIGDLVPEKSIDAAGTDRTGVKVIST